MPLYQEEEPEANPPAQTDLPPELNGLPVDHLFMLDPLQLTSSDLSLLANHYRTKRLNFLKAEETKPKTVEKNRNPKLDAEKTKESIDNILAGLIGGSSEASDE